MNKRLLRNRFFVNRSVLDTLEGEEFQKQTTMFGLGVHAKDGDDGSAGGDTGGDEKAGDDGTTVTDETEVKTEVKAETKKDEVAADDSKLSDEAAKSLREVMKWKQKARDLEAAEAAANKRLEEIQAAMGETTIDDVKGLIESKKDEERRALEAKGEYESIVEQMRTEHTKSLASVQEQLESLKSDLQSKNQLIDNMTIGRSFSESPFIRESSALPSAIARKEFGDHFDLVEGEVVAYDKPRGAEGRAPLVDANGQRKAFEDALSQLYEAHPEAKSLLRSKQNPGAASDTTTTSVKDRIKSAAKPAPSGLERIRASLGKAS